MAMVVGIIVLWWVQDMIANTLVYQNKSTSRLVTSTKAEQGLERMLRDLRHAEAATFSSSATTRTALLTLPTRQATASTSLPTSTVTWTCTIGASCTRQVAGGTLESVIRNVAAVTFTPTDATGAADNTDPVYVGVEIRANVVDQLDSLPNDADGERVLSVGQAKLQNPATGQKQVVDPVTLRDGVSLRNL